MSYTGHDVEDMADQMCTTAIWAGGLDSATEVPPGMKAAALRDCQELVRSNGEDLGNMSPEDAGHNFLLSRDGHGTGFWDRGLGERGDRLHAAAKAFGEFELAEWLTIEEGA